MNDYRVYLWMTKEEKETIVKNSRKCNLSIKEYLLKDKLKDIKYEEKEIPQTKEKVAVHISIDPVSLMKIDKLAKEARMSRSRYLTKVGSGERIVIVKSLKNFVDKLNRIGNNLNQLTVLAHRGEVNVIKLDNLNELLLDIKKELNKLLNEKH